MNSVILLQAPVPSRQMSFVHGLPSLQLLVASGLQLPPLQTSPTVHA
jgi:hypothetical protein